MDDILRAIGKNLTPEAAAALEGSRLNERANFEISKSSNPTVDPLEFAALAILLKAVIATQVGLLNKAGPLNPDAAKDHINLLSAFCQEGIMVESTLSDDQKNKVTANVNAMLKGLGFSGGA